MTDSGSSARDRRRERYEANKPRVPVTEKSLRKAVVPAVALLVVSGLGFVIYSQATANEGCPGHWHATFRVFDQGEELRFQHSRFDMSSGMPMRTHLHQPDDAKMHLEGGCATTSDFFRSMGMKLTKTSLELDGELHDDRVLKNDGNLTLRFFVEHEGNWTEMPGLPSYQPQDGDRMLITYGNQTEEEIAEQQKRVPKPY